MIADAELKRIHYFSALGQPELATIARQLLSQDLAKGSELLRQGERSEYIYFIVSGIVKVYKTSVSGKELILNVAYPGESLNDVSIYDNAPSPASMLAITPVRLLKISKPDLVAIMAKIPQVAQNALRVMASRVRRDSNLAEDLSFYHVTERVARLLLKNINNVETDIFSLKQSEIAAAVGATRESVNKSIRELEENDLISLTRHGIKIKDLALMMEYINTQPQQD